MSGAKEKTETAKHLAALQTKIKKFLSKEAPPDVLIIKSHLICEYYLNQILIVKEICDAGKLVRMRFPDKIDAALDKTKPFQEKLTKRLRCLNKLRNKVGHELEYALAESDVDSLGYLDGKDYVLNKYDFEDPAALLRGTLLSVVIDTSVILLNTVEREREMAAKGKETPIAP